MIKRIKKIKEKIISPEEKVLIEFGIAENYARFWIFLGILTGAISLIFVEQRWLGLLLAITLIVYGFYLKFAYFYFLTDKRLIFYYHFFNTEMITIDYQKITDISARENFLERIFLGSGNLSINTAGGPKEEIIFSHIANPYDLKRRLNEIRSKALLFE